MILKENYDGKTTLKQWWRIVRDNFRTIAENAVSKKELDNSVSTAITQYVSEDMEALEDVRQALAKNADVIDVLNSSITSISNHKADAANPHGVTAEQVGLGNVKNVEQASREELEKLENEKAEVVFGTYNYQLTDLTILEEERVAEAFIKLGFRPSAVEVYSDRGQQTHYVYGSSPYYCTYGGLAIDGFPLKGAYESKGLTANSSETNRNRTVAVKHIEITDDGFYIRDVINSANGTTWGYATYSYVTFGTHYFKAYRCGRIAGDTNDN